jgi:hypothetical protein
MTPRVEGLLKRVLLPGPWPKPCLRGLKRQKRRYRRVLREEKCRRRCNTSARGLACLETCRSRPRNSSAHIWAGYLRAYDPRCPDDSCSASLPPEVCGVSCGCKLLFSLVHMF